MDGIPSARRAGRLPRAGNPNRCPVKAPTNWCQQGHVDDGPSSARSVRTQSRSRPLHPEPINTLIRKAVARAGLDRGS